MVKGLNRVITGMILAGLLVLTACGGGGGTTNSAANPAPAPAAAPGTAQVGINMGDAPSDRVVSFEITITSLILTNNGAAVTGNLLTAPRKLELTHLAGTAEPLEHVSVPQGTTANGATIAFSSIEITVLDATGLPKEIKTTASGTIPVTFTAFTVNAASAVVTFDLNLAKSITNIDLTTNPPTITLAATPVVTLAAKDDVPGTEVEQEKENEAEQGEVEVVGTVSAVTATDFSITVGQSTAPLKFTVNANTKFEDGLTGLASLKPNVSIVKVEGVTTTTGLLAREVEAEGEGAEAEGLVTAVSVPPAPNQFSMVAHDSMGVGNSSTIPGQVVTVTVASGAKFVVNTPHGASIPSGLNFAVFSDLAKAQRVEADTDATGMVGTSITAKKVKLLQQALSGTIAGSGASLTVDVNSAFATLTGSTSVTLNTALNPSLKGNLTSAMIVTNGTKVRARGLLFFNSTTKAYTLLVTRFDPDQSQ